MATVVPVNPKPFLQQLTGQNVYVRLKWGLDYSGFLVSTDGFMNVLLANAEEFEAGGQISNGSLGEVLIRCNNVLYIITLCQKICKSESMSFKVHLHHDDVGRKNYDE